MHSGISLWGKIKDRNSHVQRGLILCGRLSTRTYKTVLHLKAQAWRECSPVNSFFFSRNTMISLITQVIGRDRDVLAADGIARG